MEAPITSLPNRPHSALLVVDLQRGVVAHAYEVDRVVANFNTLVDRARADESKVVYWNLLVADSQ